MNLLSHLRRKKQSSKTPRNISVSTRLPSLPNSNHNRHPIELSPSKSSISKCFSKQGHWEQLPPIYQLRRSRVLQLQQRKSQVIENLLLSKHENERSHSHRNKTEIGQKRKYILSHRSSVPINFDEVRMKPIDQYYKRLDNIRLAERLLTIKPTPTLNRRSLKKFYLQQRNYKSQLSKNCDQLKLKTRKRGSKLLKEWFF